MSLLVGLHGAKVPLPIRMNIVIQLVNKMSPVVVERIPATRNTSNETSRFFSMASGTSITAVTGSMSEEICLSAELTFLIDHSRMRLFCL